jgi:hypothetical protein
LSESDFRKGQIAATFYDRAFLVGEKTAFGWSALPDSIAVMLYLLLVGTIGMLPSCATALGEAWMRMPAAACGR